MKALIFAMGDWVMDRLFNRNGRYADGRPFHTFQELWERYES